MIINQTGVSPAFTFAGTGDQLVVAGVMTNLGSLTVPVIRSLQAGNTVTNGGHIASFGAGDAITMTGGGTVTNSGLISGAVTATATLNFASTGRVAGFVVVAQGAAGPGSVVTNRGTMVFADAPGTSAHLANAMIALGAGNDTVINSGKLVGDVYLGDGADIFDGRGGMLLGSVFGGLGDDLYYLTQASTISDSGGTDTINARLTYTLGNGIENLTLGGFGNFKGTGNTADNTLTGNTSSNVLDGLGGADTLLGGAGNDTLLGGTNADSLDGQNGNDRVSGGYGADTVSGGDGNDSVIGDTGTDLMAGGNGADTLEGGIGADTMDGGDGDDVLIGGAFGTDVMTGGLGADRFVYATADDSFATLAADVIADFAVGIDKIDLSALADAPLLFMAGDPFSLAAASVRVTAGNGGATTLVSIDLDFDGTADLRIVLTGALVLGAADFVL